MLVQVQWIVRMIRPWWFYVIVWLASTEYHFANGVLIFKMLTLHYFNLLLGDSFYYTEILTAWIRMSYLGQGGWASMNLKSHDYTVYITSKYLSSSFIKPKHTKEGRLSLLSHSLIHSHSPLFTSFFLSVYMYQIHSIVPEWIWHIVFVSPHLNSYLESDSQTSTRL